MGILDIVDDRRREVIEEVSRRVETALTEVGIHIEGEAKEELENDPRRIDTGLLRNSITYALGGEQVASPTYSDNANEQFGSYSGNMPNDSGGEHSVYIGTNVEYAEYVHEGTNRMKPNRFLKNACEKNKEQVMRHLKDALES